MASLNEQQVREIQHLIQTHVDEFKRTDYGPYQELFEQVRTETAETVTRLGQRADGLEGAVKDMQLQQEKTKSNHTRTSRS